MALAEQKCIRYTAGTPALSRTEAENLAKEIPLWTLKDKSIDREFKFSDFREAMDFVDDVADIAETEDHHPDIRISYNIVAIELSTHKVNGLSKNDFIVAAKIDNLL